ncbi:MAG: Uncharacterized protein XD72_2153 [Methanothrix harundinacea]|jgi:hypothetical protein|uniref:Uncharacterized protein n=1 Tax=Methanothrix harundinacea TaxID=301375 RepID=A0A101FSC6_9EURY|nr:MAG: Uncharacterized protein XD72_2153 [Methanothrix harundinacea]KUK96723.1 MAG: Uncharacterized protein XE07_0932 [Methanothrix harundinacea]
MPAVLLSDKLNRTFQNSYIESAPLSILMSVIASEEVDPIIRRSLQREIGLLEMKKRLTDAEIKDFERKYGMDSNEFLRAFEDGELGDAQDCFEWWGLLRGRTAIEDELRKAKMVL